MEKLVHKTAIWNERVLDIVCTECEGGGRVRKIFEWSPIDTLPFDDIRLRQVAVELLSVWQSSHSIITRGGKLSNAQAVFLSRQYRSVLQRTFGCDDQTMVWGLFEALFLSTADLPIVYDLCAWAQQSFPYVQSSLAQLREESARGHAVNENTFWKTVLYCLASCQFDVAANVLEEYEKMDAPTKSFISTLRAFQMHWLSHPDEITNLLNWQKKLENEKEKGMYAGNLNIEFLVRLLLGDQQTFDRVSSAVFSNWWELVPILVLVKYPHCPAAELTHVVEECRKMYPSSSRSVYDALFELDAISVIESLSPYKWISVHLAHLLFNSDTADVAGDLRVDLLLEYGSQLFGCPSLWEAGACYLEHAGEEGKAALENHLCALHLPDEQTAKKAWRIADRLGLLAAVSCVAATMTNRYLARGEWISTLKWSLRDQIGRSMETAVSAILDHATGEEMAQLEVLEQLGDFVLRTPSLTLLFNFYRFHLHLKEKKKDAAMKILMCTMVSSDVPSSFRSRLFSRLLDLLTDDDGCSLDTQEVYELLSLVQLQTMECEGGSELVPLRLRLIEVLAQSITHQRAVSVR